jgi:hypothetical protein
VVTVSSSTLKDNQAQGGDGNGEGGAIASVATGTITVNASAITGNQALGGVGPSALGDATGGALYLQTGNANISGSTLSGNAALGKTGSTVARPRAGPSFPS